MKKEQLHLYVFPKMNDVPHSFFPSRYEQIHGSKTPDIIFINTRNNPLGIYRQIVTARIGFGWWEIIVPHCLRIISSHWQLEIGNAARRLIGQQIYPVLVTLLRGFLTSSASAIPAMKKSEFLIIGLRAALKRKFQDEKGTIASLRFPQNERCSSFLLSLTIRTNSRFKNSRHYLHQYEK